MGRWIKQAADLLTNRFQTKHPMPSVTSCAPVPLTKIFALGSPPAGTAVADAGPHAIAVVGAPAGAGGRVNGHCGDG